MSNGDIFYTEVWNNTLKKIQETSQVKENAFDMYFTRSKLNELTNEEAIIVVPGFVDFTIMKEYLTLIETCLQEVVGRYIKASIIEERNLPETLSFDTTTSEDSPFRSKELDPKYTFATFVRGRSNLQAAVAADVVSRNPGLAYNPLFIYGNSGIGKTHLLSAIGHLIKETTPNAKVAFVTGSDFVDYVYQAYKEKKYDELKNTFKNVDLLLVDDIQFIADKPKSHEIFFNIFNELVNNKKQIVVTSDKSPTEIKGLEERLITRFNQGLTVNIIAPEYETSVNILKMKINQNISISQQIDDDVISYMATNFSQNVRSLEGALSRLLFYAVNFSDDKDHISLKTTMEAFKGQISENKDELSISQIRKVVCDYYNLTKQQICSKVRTKNIANARHMAIYLCRKLLDAPYDTIGNEFGKRDHATIMNSCERIEEQLKTNPACFKAEQELESRLKLDTSINNE